MPKYSDLQKAGHITRDITGQLRNILIPRVIVDITDKLAHIDTMKGPKCGADLTGHQLDVELKGRPSQIISLGHPAYESQVWVGGYGNKFYVCDECRGALFVEHFGEVA